MVFRFASPEIKLYETACPPAIYVGIAVVALVLTGNRGILGSSCDSILFTIDVLPAENSPTKAMVVLPSSQLLRFVDAHWSHLL